MNSRYGTLKVCGLFLAGMMAAFQLYAQAPQGRWSVIHGHRVFIPAPAPVGEASGMAGKPYSSNDTAVVTFVNDDRMHGTLDAVEPAAYGLRWKSSMSSKPVDYAMDALASVTLPSPRIRRVNGAAAVKLTNGDELSGNIVLLDKEKLVLDTWYGGKLTIGRPMLKTILPGSGGGLVYEGPDDLKNWIWMGGNAGGLESWKLKDGVLSLTAATPIGRYIDGMPDMAKIEFTVKWNGSVELYFWFCASKIDGREGGAGCYSVRISGSECYLMRQIPNEEPKALGQVTVPELENRIEGNARIGIMVNKKDKRFVMTVDGRVVRECVDSGDFAGTGNGLQFQNTSGQSLLSISGIAISVWDGTLPRARNESEVLKEDAVKLVNGDKVSGDLRSIAAGKVKVKTPFGELDVPLERVEGVQFATDGLERARRNKYDVRGLFTDGGQVTVELVRLAGGGLEGRSENFGAVKIPVEAFRQLEFNIYRQRTESEEERPPEEGQEQVEPFDLPADPFGF